MAKFRYSMQSILDIKLKLETQAKQDFSAAKAALDEEEEKLRLLKDRKRGYEEEARQLLEGTLNLRDIEDNKMAVVCMDDYIAGQQERVRAAGDNLERAREALTEVMKERKTHEILKEKAFQQFREDEKHREGKEVDELTSYKYGQRRKAEEKESIPV